MARARDRQNRVHLRPAGEVGGLPVDRSAGDVRLCGTDAMAVALSPGPVWVEPRWLPTETSDAYNVPIRGQVF